MKTQNQWSPLIALALLSIVPAAAQRTYDCGNLNQRACTHSDWERVNMVAGDNRACEHDLMNVDGFCRNNSRNVFGVRSKAWYGWALEDQMLGIGRRAPINFITWPASHNAYSNTTQGFNSHLYTNHVLSITDQLNLGARHLELDPKYYYMEAASFYLPIPISDKAVRICHASSTFLCTLPGYANRLFGFALKEIADWVDANPGQVVYIKLDNAKDIGDDIKIIYEEVQRYLGNRIYPAPTTTPTRWPSIEDIRKAGKSIIVVQHNEPKDYATTVVWKAVGLLQEKNWPNRQDLDSCTADDGYTPITRSANKSNTWWDIAEGRARTNIDPIFGADTGVLWEEDVVKATRCGAAVIGLDFINALNSPLNVSRAAILDRRLERMVWSWEQNDWGRNGPAAISANGHWNSIAPSNAYPVACAKVRGQNDVSQDRQWRITGATVPWNVDLANAQCRAEYGDTYEFAAPENGFQNHQLFKVTAGRVTWLNYSAIAIPDMTVSQNSLLFRMNPGAAAPPAQTITIASAPGSTIRSKFQDTLPLVYNLPSNALATGVYNLSVGLPSNVSTYAAGTYRGTLSIANNETSIDIPVTLVVRAATTTQVEFDRQPLTQGKTMTIRVEVRNGSTPSGDGKIYRVRDENGNPVGEETIAAFTVANSSPSTGLARPDISNLPLGTHSYVAYYGGNAANMASSSEEFTITVVPRIVATPSPVTINYTPGSPMAIQSVSLRNLASGAVASSQCAWLKFALNGTTLNLQTDEVIRTYAVGSYTCTVTVTDTDTSRGGGSLSLPVTLNVQTTFASDPTSISLLGEDSAYSDVNLRTSNNSAIPVSFSANQPWIIVEQLDSNRTPARYRVYANGSALAVGRYTGNVTFTSPNAPALVIPVTFDKVNAVTINTNPAGRSYSVDGVTYTTPMRFVWAPNSVHTLAGIGSTSGGVRSTPTGWVYGIQGIVQPSIQVTADKFITSYTAMFKTEYQLLITGVPGGVNSLNPRTNDSYFVDGTVVTVETTPNPGWKFLEWIGTVSSQQPRIQVTMNQPVTVTPRYTQISTAKVVIQSVVAGANAIVDGIATPLPATFTWEQGSTHTIQMAEFSNTGRGIRHVFTNWSNGVTSPLLNLTVGTDTTLTANYQTQFLVAANPSPANAGSVTGGNWYPNGATATLVATANAGFRFTGYSGGVTSTNTQVSVTVNGPLTIVANFTTAGDPALKVSAGERRDGQTAGTRIVPIIITNAGLGLAEDVRLTGITNIRVIGGTGQVSLLSTLPISLGNLVPGASKSEGITFDWPTTASRIQFSVSFTAANGTPGVVTLSLFR